MYRLTKLLIKRSFKSLFKTRLFSILIMFLIFISGATYTMLSSSANAFRTSYNQVQDEGKLHDYVIKENFQFSKEKLQNSHINLTIKAGDNYVDIDKSLTLDKLKAVKGKLKGEQDSNTSKLYYRFHITFNPAKDKGPTGIYASLKISGFSEYINIYKKKVDDTLNQEDFNNFKKSISEITSNVLGRLRAKQADIYVKKIREDFGKELYVKNTNSLYVLNKTKSFKVVEYQGKDVENGKVIRDLNNMVIYDGTKYFTPNITDKEFKTALVNLSGWENAQISTYKIFKQAISNGTKVYSITDPNAFQAIVSPAYANKNGKKSIDVNTIKRMFDNNPDFMDNDEQDKQKIFDEYGIQKKNIIYVGATLYFITGIGTTPDFAYPIVDQQVPVVDADNQAVVFVSDRGYKRIFDAFRTNPQENYVSIKFKEGVSKKRKQEILDKIKLNTTYGTNGYPQSIFPSGIDLITKYNQTGDQVLLTQERVNALPSIEKTISTISYTTTTLLAIFIISIITLIFKVLIAGRRKVYATMLALGYSKFQIGASNAMAGMALASIPSVIAYGTGYGLQFVFMSFFNSMWTLPAYGSSFSWMSLLIILVIPTLIVAAIIYIATLVELRHKIPPMLGDALDKITWVERFTNRISFFNAKTKYIIGLTLKNIGKLSLVALSSGVALISIMIGIGTIGRADAAYNATTSFTNYNFAIDLTTPTKEGGQYSVSYSYDKDEKHSLPLPDQYNTSQVDKDAPLTQFRNKELRWHVPSVDDTWYVGQDPDASIFKDGTDEKLLRQAGSYLKNVLQTQFLLRMKVAGAIDPWSIASRLMPENQKNISNEGYAKLIAGLYKKYGESATAQQRFEILNGAISGDSTMPYVLSYNDVIINKGDELYTYIKAKIPRFNRVMTIRGVDENTIMVNLDKKTIRRMNNYQNSDDGITIIPVVINKYISTNWKLDKGDTLDISISNYADRHHGNAHKKTYIKVMGIVNTYNDSGIYTTRTVANKVLGLLQDKGFNGVFSKSKNPLALSTLPLYSESGLYTGTDSYQGDWIKFLDNYIKLKVENPEDKSKKVPIINNPSIHNSGDFIREYSATPYVSMISNVRWKRMDEVLFKNITKLSSTIINIIEGISIALSVIFTLIIASLLFKINEKKIAALWILGYRRREINRIFLSMYVIPVLLSIMVAVPLSIGVLLGLEAFIINFGHVLIPLTIDWWNPIVSIIPIILIFAVSTTITIFKQRNTIALAAFKGD